MLIKALPAEASLWSEVRTANEQAEEQSKVTRLRERKAYWDEQKRLRGETA